MTEEAQMERLILGQLKVHVTDDMTLTIKLTAECTVHTSVFMLECQRHKVLHSGHVDIGSQLTTDSCLTVPQEHDKLLQIIVITDFVPPVHRLQVSLGYKGCHQHYHR